ncbi:MAG: glycine cleavage T C-terminal barrel domain-containing protein [Myxococcota bacterium]|nr:glycine cleavage T C-terminal barrel domain-containing protein [Myxococcota bacterium]
MTQDQTTLELAREARRTGFLARLGGDDQGLGSLGAIQASGPDVLSFIHSQVTNEVEGLESGQGNYSARVTLQGKLVELFSVHRLDANGQPEIWMILERDRVASLLAELEVVLFADDVQLADVSENYYWWALEGGAAPALVDQLWPEEGEPFGGEPNFSIRSIEPGRALGICRSLGGDPGFLIALPVDDAETPALEEKIQVEGRAAGLLVLEEPQRSSVLETLRIEAGLVRMDPDTRGRKRVLPETGLEQHAVSYTKGCYLGQEVIARIRTYGALPFGLRGLVLGAVDAEANPIPPEEILSLMPPEGEALLLEDGSKVGQVVSRTHSPVLDAAIAYAYLDKAHRVPGTTLNLRLGPRVVGAEVRLLPFYSAPDREERVAWLYDRGVRDFAAGRETEALDLLEEALRLDPSFSDGYEAVGVMLGRSERFHEAIDIFKRLEEIAPEEPMVNTNLSLYFMKIGDKESAENESARAMQKDMARQSGRKMDSEALDRVLAEQGESDARRKKEMFGQVLEFDPDDPVALFGMGNASAALGEWEEAIVAYARATSVEAENSAVYLAHGRALERVGRKSEAETVYRAGMLVASKKGDLMPLKEMEHRVLLVASGSEGAREESSPGSDKIEN